MRTPTSLSLASALAGCVAFAACRGSSTEAPAPQPTAAPGAAPAAAQPAATTGPDPLCMAQPSVAPEETLTIGGKTWKRVGTTLSLEGADADDEFVLGQITDVKDHSAENAANLAAMTAWMKSENVDAIALTGDLGETPESIEKVLRDVAAVDVPVFVIIGNRECRDHFNAAVSAVQRDRKNVVNMNQVRVVNADDVSLVSLPGYHNPAYLHCANGCSYSRDDVSALSSVVTSATAAVKVLISHGPPRQSGALALDRMQPENANVGDPELAAFLAQDPALFPFGLFGNIQEAGGYATNLDGSARVATETFADSLYLNPGPADAVRWAMNDGSESVGMAGLVKFKGKQALYKVFRMKGAQAAAAGAPAPTPAPTPGTAPAAPAAPGAAPAAAPPAAK